MHKNTYTPYPPCTPVFFGLCGGLGVSIYPRCVFMQHYHASSTHVRQNNLFVISSLRWLGVLGLLLNASHRGLDMMYVYVYARVCVLSTVTMRLLFPHLISIVSIIGVYLSEWCRHIQIIETTQPRWRTRFRPSPYGERSIDSYGERP